MNYPSQCISRDQMDGGNNPFSTTQFNLDIASYLRTEDIIYLNCKTKDEQHVISSEGFGSSEIFLTVYKEKFTLWKSAFIIEQATSVHMLNTQLYHDAKKKSKAAHSGNTKIHKTLTYGNAIILRHLTSRKYLTCQPRIGNQSDYKLRFVTSISDGCWFIVLPGNTTSCIGDKVKSGDGILLKNHLTERYIYHNKEEHPAAKESESEAPPAFTVRSTSNPSGHSTKTMRHKLSKTFTISEQFEDIEYIGSKELKKIELKIHFKKTVWGIMVLASSDARDLYQDYLSGEDYIQIHSPMKGYLGPEIKPTHQQDVKPREIPSHTKSLSCLDDIMGKCNVLQEDITKLIYKQDTSGVGNVWRVETIKSVGGKWGASFVRWGQAFNLVHVVTGKYLAYRRDKKELCLVRFEDLAEDESKTIDFKCLSSESKINKMEIGANPTNGAQNKVTFHRGKEGLFFDEEEFPPPQIKFAESSILLLADTSIEQQDTDDVPCIAFDTFVTDQKEGANVATTSQDHKYIFSLNFSLISSEKAYAANLICVTEAIVEAFKSLRCETRQNEFKNFYHVRKSLRNMLSDLKNYLDAQGDNTWDVVDSRDPTIKKLTLRAKQTLFSSEGILLELPVILAYLQELRSQIRIDVKRDHMRMINELTRDILEVIALMIDGNPENCQILVKKEWLDIFFDLLDNQAFFEGVLKVLHLAVKGSPTVLTLFSENKEYFDRIFNLLEKFGRNEKVLDLLSALCVHEGVAIRRNQDSITELLLRSKLRNSLFLKTYSVGIVDHFRPNLFLHYIPNSASYAEWFFEVEFQSTSDTIDENLHARVGWAYAEYFNTEPTAIAYESVTQLENEPVMVGVGSDLTSFGFDGEFIRIGGNKYPIDKFLDDKKPFIYEPITIGCYIDMHKGRAWFFLNGKQVGFSITGIMQGEFITPVVSLRGQVEAVVRLGKEFGIFKYPPSQHLFKPAPLCDARLSNQDTIKIEKWVCPDQMANKQIDGAKDNLQLQGIVNLSSPICLEKFGAFIPTILQDSDPMTPSTSLADGRRKSITDFSAAFQMSSKKQDLAEFLHDSWSEKCISLGYKKGSQLDPLKWTMRELDYFDKLDESVQDEYVILAEVLIDGLNKYECNFDLLTWKYERPRRKNEPYNPIKYNLAAHSKPHWNRYHEAISRQLAEYVHNQLCMKKIVRGWRYGYEMDEELMMHPSLRPLESFDQSTLTYLRLRHLINSTIQLVLASGGANLESKQDEETKKGSSEEVECETKFTTFKVSNQFAVSYDENGSNLWYFEAIIKSEGQIRVGWASTQAGPGVPLGDDKHSYAFSGYLVACKCHNNTESFGRTWKKDSILGCFLDLKTGTIMFSLDGQFLRSNTNVKNAFNNIPTHGHYVPAVSLGPEQKVALNFGQKPNSLQMLQKTFEQSEAYTPFGQGIICHIPIYISQKTNGCIPIKKSSSLPVAIMDPTSASNKTRIKSCIKLQFKKKTRMQCISLNMGICPLKDRGETFSFSISIPNPEKGHGNIMGFVGFTTSHFTLMQSHFQSQYSTEGFPTPGPVYSLDKECMAAGIVGEEDTPGELTSFYLVPFAKFIEQFTNEKPQAVNTNYLRIHCVLDLTNNQIQFFLEEDYITEIPIRHSNFYLYPTVLYAGNHGEIIEFDFNPFRDCSPVIHGLVEPTICGDNVITERIQLRISKPHKWSHLELTSDRFEMVLERDEGVRIKSNNKARNSFVETELYDDNAFSSLSDGEPGPRKFSRVYSIEKELTYLEEDTFEFFPFDIPRFDTELYQPNKSMYLLIPEESSLISLMDAIENKQLIEFYTKTILLLISVCEKDFIKAKEMVLEYVGFQHLLSSLELGIQQLIPVQLSLAIYKLCIALFLEEEFNLKLMTRKESLIEMKLEPCQIITVLPRDPTTYDFREEKGSGSVSHWHFYYGSQLLVQLKCMVFAKLWEIMSDQVYTCRFLKEKSMREGVLLPLLIVIKHLVLTEKLDPDEYTWLMLIIEPRYKEFVGGEWSTKDLPFKGGLLGITDLEDNIKFEVCSILDFLYDLHVRRQVYKTVHFITNIANELKNKQEDKIHYFKNQPHHPSGRELRQPPSQQIEYFLDQVTSKGNDKFYDEPVEKLRDHYEYFQKILECKPSYGDEIYSTPSSKHNRKLRDIIIDGLLGWAERIADNHLLKKIIFDLIRRYMSRVEEFRDVLARTYVLPKGSQRIMTPDASRAAEILGALGHLRSVLNIKLNQQDETRLTIAINTLKNANVLFQYPDSLFTLGVYEAVLNVMEHILRECLPKQVQSKLKKRVSVKFGTLRKMHSFGIIQNTFACCIHFLCSLIRFFPLFSIHSANSTDVFFSEIDKLIELSFIYVRSTNKDSLSSPLEVVNSLIKQNEKLTLSLKENQIGQILEFLTNTLFKAPQRKSRKEDIEDEYRHGLCYLDFLKYAVSSQERYIETNAKIVVMYFINHKETIDLALKNFFLMQTNASEHELTFYTNFLDLLGKCAPPRKCPSEEGSEESSQVQHDSENLQFRKKTSLLLQNFLSKEDIIKYLSIKGHPREEKWMLYKSALIAILDRIHGITEVRCKDESRTDSDEAAHEDLGRKKDNSFFELVDGPFLCDISRALLKHQIEVNYSKIGYTKQEYKPETCHSPTQELNYIMSAVLPVMTQGFHNIHRQILNETENHIVTSTLYATYWISFLIPEKLPGRYKKPLSMFFAEFATVVPPSIMCNFFKCVAKDIPHMRPGTSQVLFKFFQQHLEHFQSYYNHTNSELQGRAKHGEQEDLVSLFFQLLHYLMCFNAETTAKDQIEDHPIIPALVALSGCISPMTLTKTQIDELLSDYTTGEDATASFDSDISQQVVVPQNSHLPHSYYNRNQKKIQTRRRSYTLKRNVIRYLDLETKLKPYGEKFWLQIKDEIVCLNDELEQLEDPNKFSSLMSQLVDCLDQENLTVSMMKARDGSSAGILSLPTQSLDVDTGHGINQPDIPRRNMLHGQLSLLRISSNPSSLQQSPSSLQHHYKDEYTERLSRHVYFWICGPHSVLASPVTSSLPTNAQDVAHVPFELLPSKKRHALKEIITYFFQLLDFIGLRVKRGPTADRDNSNFFIGSEDHAKSQFLQRFSLRLLRGTKLFLEKTTGDDPAYRVPTSLQDIDEAGSPFVTQPKKPKAVYSADNLKFFLRVLVPILNRHFDLHKVYYLKSGRIFYSVTATNQESDELSNLFTEFVTHLPKIPIFIEQSNRSLIIIKLKMFLKNISDAIEVAPKMADDTGTDGTYNLSVYIRSGSHIMDLVAKHTGEYSNWNNIYCTLAIISPFFINLFRKISSNLEEDVVEYFDILDESIRDKIKPSLKILFSSLMKIAMHPEVQGQLILKEQIGTCIGLLTQVVPHAIFKDKMENNGVNIMNWLEMMLRGEPIRELIFPNYIHLPILAYTLAKAGRDPEVDPMKNRRWVDQFVEQGFDEMREKVRTNQDFILLWIESHLEKVIIWCSPGVFWRKFLEILSLVRIHLLHVYNADKAEQQKVQNQSQSKMGYSNIDNKYFQTMYKMVAQQFVTLISLLWRYLNKNNIREEVETEEVNDKFTTLVLILMELFDIWCESQSFKKECLSLVKCIKELIVFEDSKLLKVIFTDLEENNNYPMERRSAIILVLRRILHFAKAIPFIESNENLLNEGVKLLQEGKSQHAVSDMIEEKFGLVVPGDQKVGTLKRMTKIASRMWTQNDADHIQLFLKEFVLMKHRVTLMVNRTSTGSSRWKWLRHKQVIRNMIKYLATKQLCNMATFRVTNYLIQGYRVNALSRLTSTHNLIRNLVHSNVRSSQSVTGESIEYVDFKPLSPLVSLLEASPKNSNEEQLYLEYTRYLFQACDALWNERDENDDTMDDERDPTEMEDRKYRRIALEKLQEKLNSLEVPQMVLKVLINSGGVWSASVFHCLQLGIAILRGGNEEVQESMLHFITKTCPKETPLFHNISKLITTSPVLDLELFNRGKAIMAHGHTTSKINALGHYEYTIALFRFLQLLCEGHNARFQEYLHTQAGKSTTVNLVQTTVDYLLLMQESVSSFCWHYNNMEYIEVMGQDNISCAFSVIKQVLITLTEYIQGPCKWNQTALSRSRLWDAIQGLLRLFAYLQVQLSNTNSIELLREVLKVLSDMITLLLSMLEGNQMSSEIGVSMKHTLVDCRNELQYITKFCFMFIKLNDTITSEAFTQYDTNKDGRISRLEFERALQSQKQYSREEVDYLMQCGDTNRDGYIDYTEFLDRFLLRAEEIGFNLVVLLQNLFEHLPKTNSDFELNDLRNRGKELMEHFHNHLGSIEIIGKSKTVEKVYFQIPKSCRDQWARSQIQEAKREFINTCDHENVNSKLDKFIDFSENTIFEMRHFGKLCQVEEWEREYRAKSHRDQNRDNFKEIPPGPLSQEYSTKYTSRGHALIAAIKAKSLSLFLNIIHVLSWCVKKVASVRRLRLRWWKKPRTTAPLDTSQTCWIKENLPSNMCALPGESALAVGECVELEPSQLMREAEQVYDQSRVIPMGFSDEYLDLKNRKHSCLRKLQQYVRDLTQLTHYWPLIIQSNLKISSFLVENEQTLKSLRFFSVILMNFLLLFYYQTPGNMFSYSYTFILALTASLHILLCLLLLYTYIMWKVPLECFKREKKICIEILQDSDILKGFLGSHRKPFLTQYWWDSWALKSDKFPRMYWDKHFKQKVREKYSDMDREEEINQLLGENREGEGENQDEEDDNYRSLNELTHVKFGVDYYYAVWMLFRVYISDRNLLFSLMYICFTCMGILFDHFFFAFHLLPEMMAYFSTLRTVVVSVTIHGKRLVYTTLLMSAVIFIYTVFAFRFFTAYYNNNCTDMFSCLMFHLHHAVRAGGGVSDVIAPPNTNDSFVLPRFLFDMSFFFIVIVFLLAIIQGLIIDAFGELRDREEGVRASMQNKCFICGINKDKFNQVPRGYETHTNKEHFYPNYLFFIMYLINKHDTLYTGQESYVWELYLKRKWDFFPIGCYFEQSRLEQSMVENNT